MDSSPLKLKAEGEIYLNDDDVKTCKSILSIPKYKIKSTITWRLNGRKISINFNFDSLNILEKERIKKVKYLKLVNANFRLNKIYEIVRFQDEISIQLPIRIGITNPGFVRYLFLNSKQQEFTEAIESTILADFSTLLTQPKFTDVILRCQGGDLKAHRNILSARCDFFEKMFNSENLESITQEVKCSFERDVMVAFLDYLYSEKIDESKARKLLEAADYYRLINLKLACEQIIFKSVNVGNAVSTLVFADSKNYSDLKRDILDFIGENFVKVTMGKEMVNLPENSKMDFGLIQEIMESAAKTIASFEDDRV